MTISYQSNQLHAICMDTYPMIHYLSDTSFSLIDFVNDFNIVSKSTKLAYTFDAGPNCFLIMEKETLSTVSKILKECFLKDENIRFGSEPSDFNSELYKDIIHSYKDQKGSVEYCIQTEVGSGPKIIQPVSVYEE
jgi:diphosphomevalonate decarboxylase